MISHEPLRKLTTAFKINEISLFFVLIAGFIALLLPPASYAFDGADSSGYGLKIITLGCPTCCAIMEQSTGLTTLITLPSK